MPDLPTPDGDRGAAQHCLAAWGSAEAYREWLRAQVVGYVRAAERAAATAALEAAYQARLTDIDTTDPA